MMYKGEYIRTQQVPSLQSLLSMHKVRQGMALVCFAKMLSFNARGLSVMFLFEKRKERDQRSLMSNNGLALGEIFQSRQFPCSRT